MQNQPAQLLNVCKALAYTVRDTGQGLALIGLGSVAVDVPDLDTYSSVELYVIARPGWKAHLINQLDWLEATAPIGYGFQNSPLGSK